MNHIAVSAPAFAIGRRDRLYDLFYLKRNRPMKRCISLLMLAVVALSMAVIPVSAAGLEVSGRKNICSGAEVCGSCSPTIDRIGQNKHQVDQVFDGIVTRGPYGSREQNYGDFSMLSGVWANLIEKGTRYNGDGKADPNGKYLTYVDFSLKALHTVDALRIFLDEAPDGKATNLLVDGFDILLRASESDPWTTVYSVTHLSCGNKYKVHTAEKTGLQTCYVETEFAPMKAQYIRFALTQPRCEKAPNPHLYPSDASRYFRITEIELYEATAASAVDTPKVPSTPATTVPPAATVTPAPAAKLDLSNRKNVCRETEIFDCYDFCRLSAAEIGPGIHMVDTLFDGIITRGPSDPALQNFCDFSIRSDVWQNLIENGVRYNNEGKEDPNGKYLTYVDFSIDSIYTVDALRIFLDEAPDGKATNLLVDGFDILLRASESDPWTTVYSVTELYCENKYKVYTEAETGLQTCYIETEFEPTRAQYIRFALTQPRCEKAPNPYVYPTAASRYFRITEIELYADKNAAPETVPPPETPAPQSTPAPATSPSPEAPSSAPESVLSIQGMIISLAVALMVLSVVVKIIVIKVS